MFHIPITMSHVLISTFSMFISPYPHVPYSMSLPPCPTPIYPHIPCAHTPTPPCPPSVSFLCSSCRFCFWVLGHAHTHTHGMSCPGLSPLTRVTGQTGPRHLVHMHTHTSQAGQASAPHMCHEPRGPLPLAHRHITHTHTCHELAEPQPLVHTCHKLSRSQTLTHVPQLCPVSLSPCYPLSCVP